MLGLLLHETLELTYYATKAVINCMTSTYRYFYPKPDLLMIEMKEMKQKISNLDKIISENKMMS